MLAHPKTHRPVVSTREAADLVGFTTTHIARLGRTGELRRWIQSPRAIFYDLEDVRRLASKKAAVRKKRGGRPPKRENAA